MENKTTQEIKTAKKNKNKQNKPSFLKRLVFVLLFIILLPFLIIYYSIRAIVKRRKRKKWEKEALTGKSLLLKTDISHIDKMEEYEFENYLRTLFFYDGYGATRTTWSKDHGADVILTKESEKIVVHVSISKKIVGIKVVEEALSSMKHYNATGAFIVTNNLFVEEAHMLTKEKNVKLIEREQLIQIINRVKEKLRKSTTSSELVDKFDKNILDKFPHMI